MAWDTARTKQLLLDAAVNEFSEHGLEGARVDRIAKAAGVNKERIYQYFGNKGQLFATVLQQELERLAAAVPLALDAEHDLGDYAGRAFDYHCAHPHFARLLHWEGLQPTGECAAEATRTAHYAKKIAAVAAAQEAGILSKDVSAADLVRAVIALSEWSFATPQLARMTGDALPDDGVEARRATVVRAIRKLST
jgi:AcrR family transcriptional regulator